MLNHSSSFKKKKNSPLRNSCQKIWDTFLMLCFFFLTFPNLLKHFSAVFFDETSLRLSVLTCDRELPLGADGGGVVAGDAGVVAVVLERHLGDLEGAHELLGVDGDARRGHDLLAVLAPRNAYGHVAGRHHAGDVHQLADGRRREVERLDERRNCGGGRRERVSVDGGREKTERARCGG